MTTIFFYFGKMHKFWSLSLELQVSVLEFLMKSQSWSFNQVSVSKITVSTTSLLKTTKTVLVPYVIYAIRFLKHVIG